MAAPDAPRGRIEQRRDKAMQKIFDAAAHEATMAAIGRGEQELLTTEEVVAALDAPTPLAFWRAKRGVTQKQLGHAVGVSQSYVADFKSGRRKDDAALVKRLARALRLRMEDDRGRARLAGRRPIQKNGHSHTHKGICASVAARKL